MMEHRDEHLPELSRETVLKLSLETHEIYQEIRDLIILIERRKNSSSQDWIKLVLQSGEKLKGRLLSFNFVLEMLLREHRRG